MCAVNYGRDSCRCPVKVGCYIPSTGPSQLAILILSIFIAVIVREIVVFIPLQMARLRLFRRTGQDFLDVFLF
jgi:hypothetical protein